MVNRCNKKREEHHPAHSKYEGAICAIPSPPRTETAQASKTPDKHIRTLAVVVVNDESYKQREADLSFAALQPN